MVQEIKSGPLMHIDQWLRLIWVFIMQGGQIYNETEEIIKKNGRKP